VFIEVWWVRVVLGIVAVGVTAHIGSLRRKQPRQTSER
jgi:hypothetical protein